MLLVMINVPSSPPPCRSDIIRKVSQGQEVEQQKSGSVLIRDMYSTYFRENIADTVLCK